MEIRLSYKSDSARQNKEQVGRGQYKLFIVDDPVKLLFRGPGEVRLVNFGSKSNPSLHKLQKINF